jgi:serine/threonine protein kinase/WD40 repeat protein
MTDLIGHMLGTYQIIEEIGHGGMANVYRATQPSIGREVAVKVLPPHFLQDRTFVKRFTREVQVIAKLQHPHILPVYDFGEQDGLPYIVMAYMPGGTLADFIKREGALPLAEVSRLVNQIASGLDHAHQKGIIHRDFKPSNVLLDGNGNVYLADFGIAKVAESTTQITGSGIIGTPAYMAPEVTRTDKVTPLIDVYALGVSLFEMLAGKHPYPSDTPVGLLLAHASAPIPDVRHYRHDLPEEVQGVIDRAMAKEPADRYQSAADVAADLRAVLAGESPLTASVPRPGGSGHISTVRMAPTAPMAAGLPRRSIAMLGGVIGVVAVLAGLVALRVPSLITQTITGPSPTSGATGTPILDASPTPGTAPVLLSGRILAGHGDAVSSVAISPDGKMLASGSLDKTVILWDLQADQPIRTLETPDQVYSMVFYPDGSALLVGGQSGITSIWSTQTGEQLFKQESLPAGQISVSIAPDQSAYAIASRDVAVALMDAKAYTWVKALVYPGPIWSLAYSLDSTMLAAGMGDGTISLKNPQTDEELYSLKEHTEGIKNLAFSPDGKVLASASNDATVILWDVEMGQKLFTLSRQAGPINSVAWSPDGKTLASASDDGTIILWNPVTGEAIDTLNGGENKIYSVIFNGDGKWLVSGMQDGTVALWEID